MSVIFKILLFIYIGLAVLLKVIELVSNICYRHYKVRARKGKSCKRKNKRDNFFLVLLGSLFSYPYNDNTVGNYIAEEQNRIFIENSIRAHEQAVSDHCSAVQCHNDMFNTF